MKEEPSINKISALIKDTPESALVPCTWEDTVR